MADARRAAPKRQAPKKRGPNFTGRVADADDSVMFIGADKVYVVDIEPTSSPIKKAVSAGQIKMHGGSKGRVFWLDSPGFQMPKKAKVFELGPTESRATGQKGLAEITAQLEAIKAELGTRRAVRLELDQKSLEALLRIAEVGKLFERKSELKSPLTGQDFSKVEATSLELDALQKRFDARRELADDSITATEVAALLRVTRQTPHDRVKAQSLLAIKDRNKWLFPIWQFDPDGPDGVVDGLAPTLKALDPKMSDFARAKWFVHPRRQLHGKTPIEALRAGEKDKVVAEARSYGLS